MRIVNVARGALLTRARKLLKSQARDELLALLPKGGVYAEIGVFEGDFSEVLISTLAPRTLYLVDPWKFIPSNSSAWFGRGRSVDQSSMDRRFDKVRDRFRNNLAVKIIRAESAAAASEIPDGSLDMAYIDGDHSLEGVRKDFKAYLPKLKDGGIVAGDDFDTRGWWRDGVVRGVAEFIAEGHTLIFADGDQFAIRIGRAIGKAALVRSAVNS